MSALKTPAALRRGFALAVRGVIQMKWPLLAGACLMALPALLFLRGVPSMAAPAPVRNPLERVYAFNVPAGPVGESLRQWSEQAGYTVLWTPAKGHALDPTCAVQGRMRVLDAVATLAHCAGFTLEVQSMQAMRLFKGETAITLLAPHDLQEPLLLDIPRGNMEQGLHYITNLIHYRIVVLNHQQAYTSDQTCEVHELLRASEAVMKLLACTRSPWKFDLNPDTQVLALYQGDPVPRPAHATP